jgi:hypothetical protein
MAGIAGENHDVDASTRLNHLALMASVSVRRAGGR